MPPVFFDEILNLIKENRFYGMQFLLKLNLALL